MRHLSIPKKMLAHAVLLLFVIATTKAELSFNSASLCPGDFDSNGKVEFADFLLFVGAFGKQSSDVQYNALMDMDSNGVVEFVDFLNFAGVFGTTCDPAPSESRWGVSTLAKAGESIGVIIPGYPGAVHHYELESPVFAIDEKTGEVRLKVAPADWEQETYFLNIASHTVSIYKKPTVEVSPTDDLTSIIEGASGPATIAFMDGTYADLGRIEFSKNGTSQYDTFELRAINPGAVTIAGNTVFDVSGNHNVFHGFIFHNIGSKTRIGRAQFVTPIVISGDHNRLTECVFYPRREGERPVLLSNSLKAGIDKTGRFNRIDHCAFIGKAYLQLDNTRAGAGDGDGGSEQEQGKNNPISVRVDHNFFQNSENSFVRLGRVGNRDSESIFDTNLIAGNRGGDNEHFVGKMGGFLWLNNTMEDCDKYLSLRSGGYAYIVHSYFLHRAARAILGWDRNHVIVGNYFRVNGRNTPEGGRNYISVLQLTEGAAGPQGGHTATTDWVVAYNTFDAPADIPFVNFRGKYSRTSFVADRLSAAQQLVQQGTYVHPVPPEERYKFTYPINNVFTGNLFYHREAATSRHQRNFSFLHYGVWAQNTFTDNLISSPVTVIYEHEPPGEDNPRPITENLQGLTFIDQAIPRDINGLLIDPTAIPLTFSVENYNMLPIDPNAVIHKRKDDIINKGHPLYKLMDLRDLGDKLGLNRPLNTEDVGPSWDWQPLYGALHGANSYQHKYR